MARKANTKNTTHKITVVKKEEEVTNEEVTLDNGYELEAEEELTEVLEATINEEVTEEPVVEQEVVQENVIEEPKVGEPTAVEEPTQQEKVEEVTVQETVEEEKKEENNNNRANTRINNMFGYLWNGQEMDY